jgi:hypothetical protein
MVTSLRSATGASGVEAGVVVPPACSDAPHSPQKSSPGSFADPQAAQASASDEPHCAQNFRPARFSAPQLEQMVTSRVSRSHTQL